MKDEAESKKQLAEEVANLRKRIAELEPLATQLQGAKEALRASEEKFRLYFEKASDVIYTLGPDLKVLSVSPSVESLLGYEPEELIGKYFPDLNVLAPSSLELAFSDAKRVLKGERIGASVYEFITKGGAHRFGEVSGAPVISPEGKVIAILSVGRDITERKHAEEALRESEERLRALFDHAPTGTALMDMEGQVLSANQGICRFLGYSPEEIIGMRFADFAYPADVNTDRPLYESLVRGKTDSYVIDKRIVRKHGEVVWGRLSVSLVRDHEGKPRYIIVVSEDITDRRRAEEEIRESEARYRTIMEQSPDGIYLVDVETRQILEANSAFQTMLGYSYQEILGLSLPDFVVADPGELDRRFRDVLRGKGPFAFERKYRRKDGSLLDIWVSTRVIFFGGRKAILVLAHDLTDHKRAEEQRRESHESLITILDSIEADIYVADLKSHEVLFLNRHMREGFGQEAIGQKCWSIFRGESGPCPCCTNERLVDAEGNPTGALVWEDRNPITGRWYVNSDRAIRWADGRLVRLQIALDITDRKEAERALQESEEKYRHLVEQSNDGISIIQDAIVKYANPSLASMWGGTVEEMVGTPFTDHIHPAELPRVVDYYKRRMAGEDVTPIYETCLKHKDGRTLYAELNASLITYQGKPADLVMIRDLTDRKRAEQELRESEERYRTIMEQSPDGIFLVDAESRRVMESNQAFQQLLGYTAEEMRSLTLYDLIAAPREDMDARFQEARRQKTPLILERRYRRKDGSLCDVWVSAQFISFYGKEVMCVLIRDITDRKRAEQEREKLIAELQEALGNIKTLSGLIPICANCKKIRDDKGYWQQVEVYVRDHSEARFSHGLCPECAKLFFPQINEGKKDPSAEPEGGLWNS
jgi:PAS domain S-box-containing protein